MKRRIIYRLTLVGLLLMGLYSCSIGRFIPDGEQLYKGATIKITTSEDIKDIKKVKEELNALLPEPNTDFIGMRPGLYYHYKAQRKKPGIIYKWLNKSFGQEPIYFSQVNPIRSRELMVNRLENRGFFNSQVSSTIDSINKSARMNYAVGLPKPYVLEKLEMDSDSLPIYKEIKSLLTNTEIKPGARFDFLLMEAERTRIDTELKQRGYYNFNPDLLIFEADTNQYKDKRFDLFLRLKKNTPYRSTIPYVIDSITIYPNYAISNDSTETEISHVDGIDFIQNEVFFKPVKLEPYILFREGQKYNAETARLTSNRLSAIGSYKFVNIRFNEKDTIGTIDGKGSLDADVYLSPLTKRALRMEFQALTKSNGFAGPGISVTYANRNLSKSGQNLSITAKFAYETQLSSGKKSGLSSIAGGLRADWTIPRLVPFSPDKFSYSIPKTKISLGTDFLNRSKLYTLNSVNTSFGYTWNENKYIYHELNPININYLNLSNTTAEFDTILVQNPFLARSFEQQFIAGLTYTFNYNELVDENRRHPIFITTNLDIAGNFLNFISGSKNTFLGQQYAQYVKADIDFRYYLKLSKEQTLITRVFAGLGVPFGNSSTLPFVKQYFSGGPYSVRAFNIRSLGPGTFVSGADATGSFFDQSGNIRLEGNLEYRFPIWSYLKGALFADAGNVWLTGKNNEPNPTLLTEELYAKGTFGNNWIKELGVGVGLGLRVDIQSFVVRFDLASPVRTPYLPEGQRSRIPFFDGGSNNLVFNFAIGYPF